MVSDSATFGAGEANETTLPGGGIFVAKFAGALSSETLNDYVSFDPDPATYSSTPDASGCPSGCVGTFGFEAQAASISQSTLAELQVRVAELGNGNLVLTQGGTTIGEGGSFPVPEKDDYADGDLAPSEAVDVPFTICLKSMQPFRFFVDVLGLVKDTPWLSGADYQAEFERQRDNGFYPVKVEGRNVAGESQYRGTFTQMPAGPFGFYSIHGWRQADYEQRDAELAAEGLEQIWLQTFVDGTGTTRYQATWTRY